MPLKIDMEINQLTTFRFLRLKSITIKIKYDELNQNLKGL